MFDFRLRLWVAAGISNGPARAPLGILLANCSASGAHSPSGPGTQQITHDAAPR